MKADHRHELKTNALADWIGNFPQWAKENVLTIIVLLVVFVGAGTFYFWRSWTKDAQMDEQLRFTSLVNQVANSKMLVLRGQAQGTDRSVMLLKPANDLKIFANSTSNANLAAMALIKRGETLRTELHYRPGVANNRDLLDQLSRAKESYTEAMERSPSDPSLRAAAKFGIALCEEEFLNFDRAEQLYREIADDADFEGTVSVAQAKLRLEMLSNYRGNVRFKPAPIPVRVSMPIEIKRLDPNRPVDINVPVDVNLPAEANKPTKAVQPLDVNLPVDANQALEVSVAVIEPNDAGKTPEVAPTSPEPNAPSKVPDITAVGQDSNSVSKAADANVPGK